MVKTTTPAPVDTPVAASVPVVEKTKKKTSKKEDVAAPAVPAVVEQTPVVTADAGTERSDISSELNDDIADLMKNIQARASLDAAVKVSIKAIEKKVAKLQKMMDKSTKKRKTSQNKMSGFEKPTPISDELAKFVGEPVGSLLARTAVSKKIHEYVKNNNLQNPANRRIIHPDAKLKKLLNTTGKDELSYFNLQKYLKVHFKKEVKA
jgi:chromatin remodeling complex protein RSC6